MPSYKSAAEAGCSSGRGRGTNPIFHAGMIGSGLACLPPCLSRLPVSHVLKHFLGARLLGNVKAQAALGQEAARWTVWPARWSPGPGRHSSRLRLCWAALTSQLGSPHCGLRRVSVSHFLTSRRPAAGVGLGDEQVGVKALGMDSHTSCSALCCDTGQAIRLGKWVGREGNRLRPRGVYRFLVTQGWRAEARGAKILLTDLSEGGHRGWELRKPSKCISIDFGIFTASDLQLDNVPSLWLWAGTAEPQKPQESRTGRCGPLKAAGVLAVAVVGLYSEECCSQAVCRSLRLTAASRGSCLHGNAVALGIAVRKSPLQIWAADGKPNQSSVSFTEEQLCAPSAGRVPEETAVPIIFKTLCMLYECTVVYVRADLLTCHPSGCARILGKGLVEFVVLEAAAHTAGTSPPFPPACLWPRGQAASFRKALPDALMGVAVLSGWARPGQGGVRHVHMGKPCSEEALELGKALLNLVVFCLTDADPRALERFSDGSVSNYSACLLDPSSGILYLGARDTILALDTRDFTKWRTISWEVPKDKRDTCINKGKTEADCHNYVRLLQFLSAEQIYVCGTYAFDPQCAFLNVKEFFLELQENGEVRMESGKGKCPFEPAQHYTAVMAGGLLYTATTSNFLSTAFDISRATGPEVERIRTETSPSWLSDPEFVSSVFVPEKDSPTGDDDKIYFFFTEVANEYDFYTRVRVPRVARVCKGDVGGSKTLQKRWTTFLKALLVCEDRQSGRRYDVLKDVYTLEHRPGDTGSTHFYGLFTSQWDSEEVSAVCVYRLEDVGRVMSGSYKELKKNCESWSHQEPLLHPRPGQALALEDQSKGLWVNGEVRESVADFKTPRPRVRPGSRSRLMRSCITEAVRAEGYESSLKLPDKVLTFVRDHPLMENAARAQPLLVRWGVTYTRLARAADLGVCRCPADRGELHRVSVRGLNTTLLQETPLFDTGEPVTRILLTEDWVLVGSPSSLVKLQGCGQYRGCEGCAQAGCGWDPESGTCTDPRDKKGLLQSRAELCNVEKGRCSPLPQEVRAMKGQRLLLPCVHLSRAGCHWVHPGDRHTRQRHAHLEMVVSDSSVGEYRCECAEGGAPGSEPTLCTRAAFHVVLGAPSTDAVEGEPRCRTSRRAAARSPKSQKDAAGKAIYADTPNSPSSPSLLSEGVPLTKKNGAVNGHTYANVNQGCEGRPESEAGERQGEENPRVLQLTGAPLASCEESSI
ncbi:SEM4F protein, partial [Atractosteus spatula]|nr:SEM4F protein [Atractosteus spatula]